jgi:hypothetical protein
MIFELAGPLKFGFHIRTENEPWMTLLIEDTWECGPKLSAGNLRGSLGEQKGDLVRDPVTLFEGQESAQPMSLVPYCWLNEYAGIDQYPAFLEESPTLLNAKLAQAHCPRRKVR